MSNYDDTLENIAQIYENSSAIFKRLETLETLHLKDQSKIESLKKIVQKISDLNDEINNSISIFK